MRLLLAIALTSASCGYSFVHKTKAIYVEPTIDAGSDFDANAELSRSIREHLIRNAETTIADQSSHAAVLSVRLIEASSRPAPTSDSGRRASEAIARVTIAATLTSSTGRTIFQNQRFTGESEYVSPPGGLGAVEGARRLALARAADGAAERLIASIAARPEDS